MPGIICRFHLCKHNPCKADYSASKYGKVGPPIHLQEEPKESELSAVAAASVSQLQLPAAVSVSVAGFLAAASEQGIMCPEILPGLQHVGHMVAGGMVGNLII